MCYPRSVWKKYRYDSTYPVFADYDLNLRCFVDPDLRFEYIPVSVATFPYGIGMSSVTDDVAFERHKIRFIKTAFPQARIRGHLFASVRYPDFEMLGCVRKITVCKEIL